MHSPDTELPKFGRRTLFRGGAFLAGAVVLGALPEIATAAPTVTKNQAPANYNQTIEFFEGSASTRYDEGTYFANGKGTEEPLQKVGDLIEAQTGESFQPQIEKFHSQVFAGAYGTNPAFGLCSGAANENVCRIQEFGPTTITIGDVTRSFTRSDIKAIRACFHYGDQIIDNSFRGRAFENNKFVPAKNRYITGEPIYLHEMTKFWFGKMNTGIVLDRSSVRGALWSNPAERVRLEIVRNPGKKTSVKATFWCATYPSPDRNLVEDYRELITSYVIDEEDIYDSGEYTGGNFHVMRVWEPNAKASEPCYMIRNNIFRPQDMPVMQEVLQLDDEQFEGVYGVFNQKRTDYEYSQYLAAKRRGEC